MNPFHSPGLETGCKPVLFSLPLIVTGFSSFVMLAVRTEKLLGRPFNWFWERLFAPAAPLCLLSTSHSSLLVLVDDSALLHKTNKFMERERTLLRAELDFARLRESVEWQCRDRHPEERFRLSVAPDEVRLDLGCCGCFGLDSATTVLLDEPVAVSNWCVLLLTWLLLLLFALVTKLSSEVDEEVAVDELGERMAWLGLTPRLTALTRCLWPEIMKHYTVKTYLVWWDSMLFHASWFKLIVVGNC